MSRKKNGFTLIELMVVIAIVSLLSAIVIASLSASRVKAKDSKKVQISHQIQVALELYKNDHKRYPIHCVTGPGCDNGIYIESLNTDLAAPGNKYMASLNNVFNDISGGVDAYVSDQRGDVYELQYSLESLPSANKGCSVLDYLNLTTIFDPSVCEGTNTDGPGLGIGMQNPGGDYPLPTNITYISQVQYFIDFSYVEHASPLPGYTFVGIVGMFSVGPYWVGPWSYPVASPIDGATVTVNMGEGTAQVGEQVCIYIASRYRDNSSPSNYVNSDYAAPKCFTRQW